MENYLMINGKRIDLTEEQVEMLSEGYRKEDPFERRINEKYYYIELDGEVETSIDTGTDVEDNAHAAANYCTSKELMEQRALHEILNRRLWRYSEQHGGDAEWDGIREHWIIVYDVRGARYCALWEGKGKRQGTTYFKDQKTAEAAIEEIVKPFAKEHPGFVL